MTDTHARSIQTAFDAWPSALLPIFDGTLTHAPNGFAASLHGVDAAGRLRTALLSAGELFAPDLHRLCFAIWPTSRTAQAIEASGRATLTFVFDETFYQVQLDARRVTLNDVPLACFVCSIESGEAQRVNYARLTGGIRFELPDDEERVLARWREQIVWLKQAAQGAA
jgi:hypothetical protein